MAVLCSSPFLCPPKLLGARTNWSRSFPTVAVSTSVSYLSVGKDLPLDYEQWLQKPHPDHRRRAGVLLHPTSFRGPHGIGDLGAEAFRFIDWLHSTGCSVWQVLPLVPPDEGGSPYAGQDANCGNTLLISLEELVKDGLLMKDELPLPIDTDHVNYQTVNKLKGPLITMAAKRLILGKGELKSQLEDFLNEPTISCWLEDAAYFAAIDNTVNAFSWFEWPEPLKSRHLSALENIYESKKEFIDMFIAKQFLFQRQWQKVREYAQSKGVSIMGDMPIYVGYHSADVWANKKQFLLNRKGFPLLVSGVPPDLFSETGQLWGSPLYDWKAMENDQFSWWVHRIRRAQDLYDEFRIDHFRGFTGFWAVPAEAKVAMVGQWKVGPGKSLFDAIFRAVGKLKIIAEDLGVITEDVVQLRRSIGAPGMAVLQFAFGGGSDNPHLLHNHEYNQVVYTGTHDNDTILGWWENLNQEEKSKAMKYLSLGEDNDITWALIQAAVSSVAQTAVIPMQDILGLRSSARMNTPATEVGNWSWRIPSRTRFDHLETESARLRDLLSMYGRL
ncbi:PREDICTED: 4-alpha-glucanotransferase DPE1, chloroplastic/amyloplastic [Tarenaya hassleriana]|uniref:4-alpha-glucanotransferase DPE1, chloroplastic/amyloplastic n=1 Tax=Tarenaya hassleriana TaxID=28532 RepID=UPI00053C6DD4|nr:PREDICTED: 4-alpha-glucanotransferase DPE1, chloroplastic/amyloplastic [Tarenaya hassleriana]